MINLLALGAVGCMTTAPSRVNESQPRDVSMADSVPARRPEVNLSGYWATGTGAEPTARRVTLRLQCNHTPALWLLEQSNDTVRSWEFPASQAQGVRSTETLASTPMLGRISGVDLKIGATGWRYILRYDSASEHLRGTFNGAPIWAVRQNVIHPEGCLAVP